MILAAHCSGSQQRSDFLREFPVSVRLNGTKEAKEGSPKMSKLLLSYIDVAR